MRRKIEKRNYHNLEKYITASLLSGEDLSNENIV